MQLSSRQQQAYFVQPSGNFYLERNEAINKIKGVGDLIHLTRKSGNVSNEMFEELLVQNLLSFCDFQTLCALSQTSLTFYVIIHSIADLFRQIGISTIIQSSRHAEEDVFRRFQLASDSTAPFFSWKSVLMNKLHLPLQLSRPRVYYSDFLFHQWQCCNLQVPKKWLFDVDNVTRVHDEISTEAFVERFEKPSMPVLFTCCKSLFSKGIERWSEAKLADLLRVNKKFRAGAFNVPLNCFLLYANSQTKYAEESPLYIFDCRFGETFPDLLSDYQIPKYFHRDFFAGLNELRPDFRWIIVGSKNSGSKWHVDPNNSSAWNCSLKGRKKWLMLPPNGDPPPGVYPSEDGAFVTQPLTLLEWYSNFYSVLKKERTHDLIEFIAEEGDVVFVPARWYHSVLNFDDGITVAVTQNFVSEVNLNHTLDFMRDKPAHVSGLKIDFRRDCDDELAGRKFYEHFLKKLEENNSTDMRQHYLSKKKLKSTPHNSKEETSSMASCFGGGLGSFKFGF